MTWEVGENCLPLTIIFNGGKVTSKLFSQIYLSNFENTSFKLCPNPNTSQTQIPIQIVYFFFVSFGKL